jgi:hypothetical protein
MDDEEWETTQRAIQQNNARERMFQMMEQGVPEDQTHLLPGRERPMERFQLEPAPELESGGNFNPRPRDISMKKGKPSSTLHRHMAKVLASKGRRGDTELAHVNPEEAALLKARGGSGTRNPKTGLREYWDGPGGDSDPAGLGGDAGSAGLGSDAGSGGLGSGSDSDPSGLGGGGGSPGLGSGPVGGGVAPGDSDPANLGGSPTSPGLGSSPVGTGGGVQGFMDRAKQTLQSPQAREQAVHGFMGLAAPGFGLGKAMRGAAESLGLDIDPSMDPLGNSTGSSGFDMRDVSGGAVVAPQSAVAELFQRPGELPEPTSLSLGMPGLTDLQKRAMLATYGTQGVESRYRDEAAKKYYANLLARSMINEQNQPIDNAQVLPIERQFISSAYGKEPREGDTRALLNDLRSYWGG